MSDPRLGLLSSLQVGEDGWERWWREQLPNGKRYGHEYTARCPFHDDHSPSLSVSLETTAWTCHSCEASGNAITFLQQREKCSAADAFGQIKRFHGVRDEDRYQTSSHAPSAPRAGGSYDVAAYASEKGLDAAKLAEWGVTAKGGAVRIPYLPGEAVRVRKAGKTFRWEGKPTLYGLWRLAEWRSQGVATIALVEGESDCHALWTLGIPALGVPGAKTFQAEWAAALDGFDVAIHDEGDDGAAMFVERTPVLLRAGGFTGKVSVWSTPGEHKDPCDLHKAQPDTAGTALRAAIEAAAPVGRVSVGVQLAEVVPEHVEWLWEGRLALGKLGVLDGDPGLGKSTMALDIAARMSRGLPMPGCTEGREPTGVVLLSAEDGLADTIRPRLDAAGADLTRILALPDVPGEDRPPVIPEDLDLVRAAIAEVHAQLVVIDPLMAYLSGRTDAHRDQDVRRALHQLSRLADETGAAILIVRHLNKSTGSNALYRGGGSIGIIGAARTGMLAARDPEDPKRRVLAVTKCNLAAEPDSLGFHLEGAGNGASHVVWDGHNGHSADDLLSVPADPQERGALDEAKVFLIDLLRSGPERVKTVQERAKAAFINLYTLRRAKESLRVVSVQYDGEAHSGWRWELPEGYALPPREPLPEEGEGCPF